MYSKNEKIVDFTYCKLCEYLDTSEREDPCAECLEHATNYDTKEPINYIPFGSK